MAAVPVVAAGVGLRHGRGWAVRSASFRVNAPASANPLDEGLPLESGVTESTTVGIVIDHPAQASAIIDLLAGMARPAYGELRVLGHDMSTIRGRAAVRHRVGIARRNARALPAMRVRKLVEHAAGLARPDRRNRHLLAAAILDRLSLLPWAEVPVRLAPDPIARRARLAAAAVHQPDLLLVDGLLDGLEERDIGALAEAIRDLGRDSGIVVAGRNGAALALVCDEVLQLSGGVLASTSPEERTSSGTGEIVAPLP